MPYKGSHVWKVRQKYGRGLLLLPAASVVVEREDGAILMMQRVDTGTWAIMGGYAEEGAGFRKTAITELEEEAAIKADTSDLIPFATISDPKLHITYPNGDEVHAFVHSFIIRKWKKLDQEVDKEEVADLQFFKLNEITDDMMGRVTKAEVDAYREYLRTGKFQSR